jgi:hypothetical protein
MINLLPTYEKVHMRHVHTTRLVGVSLFFMAGLCVAALALLTPSYVKVWLQESDLKDRKVALDAAFASTREAAPVSVIEDLNYTIRYIDAFERVPEMSPIIEAILSKRSLEISISAITIEREGAAPKVLINGVAKSRDALQLFTQELRTVTLLSGVDLPVASLTQAANNTFAISANLVDGEDGDGSKNVAP